MSAQTPASPGAPAGPSSSSPTQLVVPRQRRPTVRAGWPARWVTPVPEADLRRGDGELYEEIINATCRVTKDSVAAPAGQLLVMRPWQRQVLRHLFARRRDGMLRHRVGLVGIARKNGKHLDVSTPIPTPRGFVPIGELREGDVVFAPDGTSTRVLWVSQPEFKPAYRVRFADGAGLVAGTEHEWQVNDRILRRSRAVTTAELASTLTYGARRDRRYTVDVPAAVQLPEADLPVDPWLLGYWLGNGAAAGSVISAGGWRGQDDRATVEAHLRRADIRWTVGAEARLMRTPMYLRGVTAKLRDLGVLGAKHVPAVYLFAGVEQRRALLAGLLDSDGTASSTARSPRVEYSSSDERLARDVLALVRSLGWKATLVSRPTASGRTGWRLTFTAYADESPFTFARKSAGLPERPSLAPRSRTNAVVAVEPTRGAEWMCCIAVEHPSHCYLAGESFTVTHNSGLAAGVAVGGMLLGPGGGEVYSAAADKAQAKIVFDTAKRMVELDPDLSKVITVSRDALTVPSTGTVYRALSAEAFTKEGLNPHLVIFDEVHAQPTRELWDVLQLAMGSRREPLMVGITTAGVRTDRTGGDSICYELYKYGRSIARGEVDDPTFFMAWWEPHDGPDAPHDLVSTWREGNPGYDDLVSAADFESVVRRTPENEFRTKRCNQWVSSSKAWLPGGVWDALADEARYPGGPPDGTRVLLGFDGSKSYDSTALIGVTVEKRPHVFVAGLWEKTPGDDSWRIPRGEVKAAIRAACRRWDVPEIAWDDYMWQDAKEELQDENLPIEVFPQTPERMGKATQRFWEACVEGEITHDGDPRLARHVANAVPKATAGGMARIVKPTQDSPLRIDGAVAAVFTLDRVAWWTSQAEDDGPNIW